MVRTAGAHEITGDLTRKLKIFLWKCNALRIYWLYPLIHQRGYSSDLVEGRSVKFSVSNRRKSQTILHFSSNHLNILSDTPVFLLTLQFMTRGIKRVRERAATKKCINFGFAVLYTTQGIKSLQEEMKAYPWPLQSYRY